MSANVHTPDDLPTAPHARPLAHAVALRLLTAKGADAAGLRQFVAGADMAETMVDVLEELTRRIRGLRVEFEGAAATRPQTDAQTPQPATQPPPTQHPGF